MDGRKRWSSFDDGREMRSYNGRDKFKFPRTMSSANQHYSQHYNEQYNANYSAHPNENYNQGASEHYNDHYAAPLGPGANRYNSDAGFQRFPTEPGVQRAPWNQNKTEAICCCPAHEGNMCATLAAALPGLLAGAGGQGGIMMKPFLHFPVNNNNAAPPAPHLFPNFNVMDPVQKAVLKHTFGGRGGGAKARRSTQPVKCGVCQIKFNSDSQAEAHYRGSRHAKKLMMQQSKEEHNEASVDAAAKDGGAGDAGPAPSTGTSAGRSTEAASSSSAAGQAAPPAGEWDAERAKKLLYCSLCKVSVNSLMQLEAHNSGTKHKTMLDARSGSGPVKALPRAGPKVKSPPAGAPSKSCAPQNKSFHCGTCNIQVNSEIQLKQHISSRKHKDRLAGKPTKPKFNKSQRMEVSTSSDLTSPPPASSSSSLSHPAPGPIRASQGSTLFAPY